ncbi:uncharacterized protein B0I36DRAFT_322950 [Microdochium trichocladiopsis]|uniref:Uncharacterized protein n=1 Tax=Microdochium trichocladiopsis TaxID=1682393 RepID=A0A9P8Y616_9PEZI|nr:uncharacterized protein B0I36DRAFT_322950 [Microdochium trichocladiopsis]KAH7030986.1 hypothetical protein B0I36DRAFT_322950 [Microdochium trichocladiopsis]
MSVTCLLVLTSYNNSPSGPSTLASNRNTSLERDRLGAFRSGRKASRDQPVECSLFSAIIQERYKTRVTTRRRRRTMSLFQSFKNLSPRTRLLVGAGLFTWGLVGLQFTDAAGEKLGIAEPTERDREELRALAPRIRVVDHSTSSSAGGGGGAGPERK